MNNVFDYSCEPGTELNSYKFKKHLPLISVIVPFYNDYDYIEQSVNCILNQTYPYFELLIIDDGSKDEKSLKKLDYVSKLDDRIKVFHKENEGLAATRDYGASKSNKNTKYFMFIDSDDLVDKTFFECALFALETNKDASWAYADSVGFDCIKYTWNKWYSPNKMKKVNELISASVIRKEAYYLVDGYELREKSVNEDWNFWLKLISKGCYPVHLSYYALWYRRKNSGELSKSIKNRKRSLEIIKNTAKKIKHPKKGIQYPRFVYDNSNLVENVKEIVVPEYTEYKKYNILMFVPWMVTGGADFFNLDLLKRLDKSKYKVTIISSIPNVNPLRQEMEKYATIYDLTSFLDRKYWVSFVNYIIKKERINMFFCTNSMFGYSLLPYLKTKYSDIPVIDYVHMEEWYYRDGGFARMSSDYKEYIDKTLVCNNSTKNVLINHFKKDKKEVDTVYIGVDTDKYNPKLFKKDEILTKYGINNKDKYIISYICRISGQKRPMLLVKIINEIIKRRKDVLFVIAGDGDMFKMFTDTINSLGLSPYVKCLGNIKNTSEIYSLSDLTINCSIKEGLALTSYESLSMGVPVISADVGGQKELINSEVGVIVPCLQEETQINDYEYSDEEINNYVLAIDDAIKNLDELSSNARKSILDNFTLDQMAKNMCLEFEKLYSKKKLKNSNISVKEALNYVRDEFNYDIPSSYYLIQEYHKKVYGRTYIDNSGKEKNNYKLELLREKLWKNKYWQNLTKSKLWSSLKRIIKR